MALEKGREYYGMFRPRVPQVSVKQALWSHLEKNAGLTTGIAGDIIKSMAIGTGIALSGAAVAKTLGGVGTLYGRLQAARMFEELKRRHPEVKSNPKARQYYDLIVAYAPSLLKHPSAIGDFLMRQLQYPTSSVEFIKQLADLEATVSKTEREAVPSWIGEQAVHFAGSPVGQSRSMGEIVEPGRKQRRP